ncbi:MAG TPA: hypothetical protein VLC46_16410 [Thermoanaerobaculia bacterium]|jgi:hypothetical protein|nr:hypothetical protein [Thermoanaerobaculia bacterium]
MALFELVYNLTIAVEAAAALGAAVGAVPGAVLPAPQDSPATKAASTLLTQLQNVSDGLTEKINNLNTALTDSNAKLDAMRAGDGLLTQLQNVSDGLTAKIDTLNTALTDSNAKLDAMREAAGLNPDSGLGAENKKLGDALNEAQARLQYLEDKSAGTDADKRAIADQQKAVDDMTAKLNDSAKQLRIAEYELTHSDAYQQQLAEMAAEQQQQAEYQAQQADAAKKIADATDELTHSDAYQQILAEIAAEQKALADYQAQQADELKKLDAAKADLAAKQAADVAAAAQQVAGVAGNLNVIKNAQAAIAQQVQQATTTIVAATTQATTAITAAATQATAAIATDATTTISNTWQAISGKLDDAMQSLSNWMADFDRATNGPFETNVPNGPNSVGTNYASQFYDPTTGQIAGGAIGDSTYATYVQAFADSVQRYKADNAPGLQQYQQQEDLAQQQLEMVWMQTGGYQRFHETLKQIVDKLNALPTAQKPAPATPAQSPTQQQAAAISQGNLYFYMPPPPKPPPIPPPEPLQAMLSTGRL